MKDVSEFVSACADGMRVSYAEKNLASLEKSLEGTKKNARIHIADRQAEIVEADLRITQAREALATMKRRYGDGGQ